MTNVARLAIFAVIASANAGCGVSSWVTAEESKYPISLSKGLRDTDGELVADARKSEVGRVDLSYKACSMLWRLISFTGDHDISEEINQQVKAAGGDGVTHLEVESSGTVWNMVTIIGVLPDCSNVRVSGKIVKVLPKSSSAKGAAAALPAPSPRDRPTARR